MKRLSSEELDATHRIFNHVNSLWSNYYGRKTWDETKSMASQNRWIMFPVANVDSLREGASHPMPNVFIGFEDEEIKDDGKGIATGLVYLGVNYGNLGSMAIIHDFQRRKKKQAQFFQIINSLDDEWVFSVDQKAHTGYHLKTPVYILVEDVSASGLTPEKLSDMLEYSEDNLLDKGSLYGDEEVLDCITTVSVRTKVTPESFDQKMTEAFNLFQNLLGIR